MPVMDHIRRWVEWLRRVAPEHLLLLGLLAAAVGVWLLAARNLPRPLEVVAFAVGDGDAFLIRAPSGQTLLIDAGSRTVSDIGMRVLVPNLFLLGVRKLDAVLLTHPDSDHVNGLPAVLDALPVGRLLDPDIPSEDTAYQQVVESAKLKEIPRYRVRAGDEVRLGPEVRLHILAPGQTLLAGTSSDTNNNSVVCLLEYRQARMLFTGDLQSEGERALLTSAGDYRADMLKIAHHGSRNGTGEALLDAVRPSCALISCRGASASDHPNATLLARLRQRGISIVRTDVHGQIRLATYGRGWQRTTYRRAAEQIE